MPTKHIEAHELYKKQVAQKNNLSESKICHRMFHGTKTAMICKPQHFVNNKCALFCKFGCGVCGIIQEGNRKKYSHYTQSKFYSFILNLSFLIYIYIYINILFFFISSNVFLE